MATIFNHVQVAYGSDGTITTGTVGAEVYYRAILPAQYCTPDLREYGIQVTSGAALAINYPEYDAYLVHRNVDASWLYMLKLLQKYARRAIIWELDDNHWQIPMWVEGKGYLDKQVPGVDWLRDNADLIVCSTEFLAGVVGKPGLTIVCPNLIEPHQFPPRRPSKPGEPVRIIWAGSNTHSGDVELLVPAVKRLAIEFGNAIEFSFCSYFPPSLTAWLNGMRPDIAEYMQTVVRHVPRVPLERYHELLAILQPDIACAPLVDHPFNRSRTNLKWLEMSAAGAAFIGSDLDPYQCVRDGEDGILVENDPEFWYSEIHALINDQEARERMAAAARRRVLAEHSWMSPARDVWTSAFRQMAERVQP